MERILIYAVSLLSLFVFEIVIGIGNVVYADSQKTQELQMHLNKVMDELNNNNTQGAKMHLQGAQMMVSSMNLDNNTSITNHTTTTT